jgi:hypothetical protein
VIAADDAAGLGHTTRLIVTVHAARSHLTESARQAVTRLHRSDGVLAMLMRDSDTLARLGGDEFVILAEELEAEAMALTSRVLDALERRFPLGTAHAAGERRPPAGAVSSPLQRQSRSESRWPNPALQCGIRHCRAERDPGIEPGLAVLETTVLPTHQSPGGRRLWAQKSGADDPALL